MVVDVNPISHADFGTVYDQESLEELGISSNLSVADLCFEIKWAMHLASGFVCGLKSDIHQDFGVGELK